MLIVINFVRDESFQLVVIGQRALMGNRDAGIDRRVGIHQYCWTPPHIFPV
jgi:phage-related protein